MSAASPAPSAGPMSAAATGDAFFEVRGLTKRFGGLVALNGVDLALHEGKVMCVIGPNGSGKTTLFNVISGTLRADSGDKRFKGRSITDLPPHKIAGLGIARTFQSTRLFPTLTLLENVELSQFAGSSTSVFEAALCLPRERRERQRARARAEAVLAEVGGGRLYPRRFDYPHTCSLGEQRMVEIANALVTEPSLILMDEPTQGLNPVWIGEMLALIEDLKARHKTILFIEHKMSVVMRISDWVAVLNHGEKIAEGTSQDIRDNPDVIRVYLGA